jgi:hypothetical protein
MNRVLPMGLLAVGLLVQASIAQAQTVDPLPPETRLVSAVGAPSATQESFTIAAAQDLVITLTDLQVPAALSAATVVITQAGTMVGNATFAAPSAAASVNIPAAVGQYTLYVFGTPNASFSVGTFTVCVAPKSSPANCIQSASLAGNITAPSATADPTVSTLDAPLTVTASGTYTITFADDQFPAPLNSAPNLAIFQGSSIIGANIQSGTVFNLSPGTYTLLAIARADQSAKAGLFGVTISGPPGVAALFDDSFAVGSLTRAAQTINPSQQSLMLRVLDFAFPAPLGSGSAVVTAGGTKLGSAAAGGAASTFSAPAGPLKIWSFAAAGADAGTYEVDLASASANLIEAPASISNATSLTFAYLTPSLAAGTYQASATDFQFPAALQALQFAVAQGGAVVAKASTQGTFNFTTNAAGPVVLLVDATPTTQAGALANGNGLVDVNVQTTGASPQLLYDMTQGVSQSGLLDSQTIQLGISADFDLTLTDLNFPDPFASLALVVSNGGAVLGKIYGAGTVAFSAMPGPYKLTFIATPAAAEQYGLYGIQISYAAPTIMLKATPDSVAAGAATTLAWTTTDATSCTGSGSGFVGPQAVGTGSVSVQVTSTTTYILSCTGPGGAVAQSVVVTATAAPSSSGGGRIDVTLLLGLLLLNWGGAAWHRSKFFAPSRGSYRCG